VGFSVKDILKVFLQDVCIFFGLCCSFVSSILCEVFRIIGFEVARETLHDFESNVPCGLRVLFEVLGFTLVGTVALPVSFCLSFHMLEVGSGVA